MSGLARKLLLGFALLGLAASLASSWVHYHLLTNPDYTSFCDVSKGVSCSEAYLSRYGSLFGVPVALGGVLFFALVLVLLWASRASRAQAEAIAGYLFALSTIALAVVLYLAYASFFILKTVCLFCATTYIAVIGVFIISGGASSLPMKSLPGRAARDVRALVMSPIAFVIALLYLGAAAAGILLFPHESVVEARQASAQPPPLSDAQKSELERWWDLQPKVDMPFSNDGAKVLVVKFNDYQCPPCRQTYFAYEPILAQYKDRPQDVKYLMKHFPLDPKCNSSVTQMVHPAACDAAAAAVVAQEKSKATFDKLTDWFFVNQDRLSPAVVREAARDVAGIADFDARYAKAIQQVKTDASIGGVLGVGKTPTFFINGRKLEGGQAPVVMQGIIDLELKRAQK
ncbi:MAG: hypothetical protein DMF86_06105 [Acidobacteria bacterium]|nr:MAG: hypothetical protein DMF86_06105 [Acidobacteriota bacterium]